MKFASTLFLFEAYLGDAEYQKYRLRGVAKGAAMARHRLKRNQRGVGEYDPPWRVFPRTSLVQTLEYAGDSQGAV